MSDEERRGRTFFAVSRHVEGDEEGNRRRRREGFARMMRAVVEAHGVRGDEGAGDGVEMVAGGWMGI
jgi:class 3 adenylate cyclase